MKLAELSPLYEDSAQRIQRRMEQLRLDLRTADDPDSARQLRRRLTELQPMLRQCRQLARPITTTGVTGVMIHSAFDPMDIAGLHQWMQQQAGDNSQRRQRLLHNLSRAMTEELTPRQQEMLHLYYYEKLNMAQIAGRLGVNKSTVSRTLCRARHRLHHILQYSL